MSPLNRERMSNYKQLLRGPGKSGIYLTPHWAVIVFCVSFITWSATGRCDAVSCLWRRLSLLCVSFSQMRSKGRRYGRPHDLRSARVHRPERLSRFHMPGSARWKNHFTNPLWHHYLFVQSQNRNKMEANRKQPAAAKPPFLSPHSHVRLMAFAFHTKHELRDLPGGGRLILNTK